MPLKTEQWRLRVEKGPLWCQSPPCQMFPHILTYEESNLGMNETMFILIKSINGWQHHLLSFFLSVPFLVQVGPMHNTWSMRKCNGQMGTTRFPKVAKILEKILAIPEPIDFANGIIMATWHHVTRSFPKNSQNTNEIRMFISTNLGHKICPKLPENWLNKSHGNSKWQHGKLKMKTFDYSTEWGF